MNRVLQSILILAIVVSSCTIAKINNEEVLLRFHPEAGSEYDMSSNVNIALNTAQPVNINMDLFITVTFDKSPADKSLLLIFWFFVPQGGMVSLAQKSYTNTCFNLKSVKHWTGGLR